MDDPLTSDVEMPTLKEARELADRTYLNQLMRRTRGNVSRAARVSGRNRTDLHELLRRHGFNPATYRA